MKVSIVIPAYNSREFLPTLLKKILKVRFGKIRTEIIVVDDCSPDNTYEVVKPFRTVKLIRHKKNTGKGGAIRDGFAKATGDILYIQDDDLEYDPEDILKVVKPILEGKAEVCLSSRHMDKKNKYSSQLYRFGGHMIDSLINIYLGTKISDTLSGPKAFSRAAYNKIKPIESTGFELETELVAKIVKRKISIAQVPVRYYPRTFEQGKNIRWHHGFRILAALTKYR